MKRTVIATDVGGSSELVKKDKTGLLVEAGDEIGMFKAIVYLIKNPNLAEKMGLIGFNLVNKQSNKYTNYIQHINIYNRLIKK